MRLNAEHNPVEYEHSKAGIQISILFKKSRYIVKPVNDNMLSFGKLNSLFSGNYNTLELI